MRIEAASLDKRATYFLMTSFLIPRPIAWVGTRSEDGHDNLAPFSYFMGVSSDPPLIAISVARGRRGALKDTCVNLLARRDCTVSIVSASELGPMHATAAPLPREASEFESAELVAVDGVAVDAPRPERARVAMECRLHTATDLGSTHLLVLEVVAYEIGVELVDGRVPVDALEPVARLGGEYALLGELLATP
ncbi:MAG: flavin reductase family protein [Proteobacteria bacterium]|nr:flavin reductase family protein [Pseudomonadota bacterium]MCP4921627.1 flavin reductase family protein [Pseudomonadota bacterium]